MQRSSMGPVLAKLAEKVRGRVHTLEGLPDPGAVGGKARAGDWRRELRVRHCRGGGAGGKNGTDQPAARLLVSAKDLVRGSIGGIDSALVPRVGAGDFLADFSTHLHWKIFGLWFAEAGS